MWLFNIRDDSNVAKSQDVDFLRKLIYCRHCTTSELVTEKKITIPLRNVVLEFISIKILKETVIVAASFMHRNININD